jgi:dGTPase
VLNQLYPGGFEHNAHSLRVVDVLENDGRGLNLTWEVRDGIRRHSKGKGEIISSNPADMPRTPEGMLVRLADVIAYTNHDLDDSLRAGILTLEDIPKDIIKTLGRTHSKRIDTMIRDIIKYSAPSQGAQIRLSEEVLEAIVELRAFLFKNVYESDIIRDDFAKSKRIVEELYRYFLKRPAELEKELERPLRYSVKREVADFIAGMTDRYAINLYAKLYMPSPWIEK